MNRRKLAKIVAAAVLCLTATALCACAPGSSANEDSSQKAVVFAAQNQNQNQGQPEAARISEDDAYNLAVDAYMNQYGPNMSKYLNLEKSGADATGYLFQLQRTNSSPQVIATYHVSFTGEVSFTDLEQQNPQQHASESPAPTNGSVSHDQAVELAKNYWISQNPDKPTENLFAEETDHNQVGHKVWIYYSYPTHYAHLAEYTVRDDGAVFSDPGDAFSSY